MSRSITINTAILAATPSTAFDPVHGTGTITATYVVGQRTTGPNGSDLLMLPEATSGGSVSVTLSATDTAPASFPRLVAAIFAAEGLSAAAGDHLLDQTGAILV